MKIFSQKNSSRPYTIASSGGENGIVPIQQGSPLAENAITHMQQGSPLAENAIIK